LPIIIPKATNISKLDDFQGLIETVKAITKISSKKGKDDDKVMKYSTAIVTE
jgi:hypothetical protein